jgi:hypothetical protein
MDWPIYGYNKSKRKGDWLIDPDGLTFRFSNVYITKDFTSDGKPINEYCLIYLSKKVDGYREWMREDDVIFKALQQKLQEEQKERQKEKKTIEGKVLTKEQKMHNMYRPGGLGYMFSKHEFQKNKDVQ